MCDGAQSPELTLWPCLGLRALPCVPCRAQQHVHLYVDDPTRKKEEKRMLKRTKAEDDRRKKEEDKVRTSSLSRTCTCACTSLVSRKPSCRGSWVVLDRV
jgi:hypothetical protein